MLRKPTIVAKNDPFLRQQTKIQDLLDIGFIPLFIGVDENQIELSL